MKVCTEPWMPSILLVCFKSRLKGDGGLPNLEIDPAFPTLLLPRMIREKYHRRTYGASWGICT